jgi:hypothetical protein
MQSFPWRVGGAKDCLSTNAQQDLVIEIPVQQCSKYDSVKVVAYFWAGSYTFTQFISVV